MGVQYGGVAVGEGGELLGARVTDLFGQRCCPLRDPRGPSAIHALLQCEVQRKRIMTGEHRWLVEHNVRLLGSELFGLHGIPRRRNPCAPRPGQFNDISRPPRSTRS